MLDQQQEGSPFGADDIYLETVAEARLHVGALLQAAARDLARFASPNVVCERTGLRFSGRVAYRDYVYRGDGMRVFQILHIGRAAMGEYQAQQTLSMVRESIRRLLVLAAPRKATDAAAEGGPFSVSLIDGCMDVSIELTDGEATLTVLT
ncbi:hypothetical protein APB26_31780 [Pseudomonas aeruginosa]|nr:hypothetical protein APB26_31780 [Pseudomonas aeruginosa]RPV61238.1 hypothetical protein IPC838_18105 [Pseudomonas aeruginosa]